MRLPARNTRLVLGIVVITACAALAHVASSALFGARASFPQLPLMRSALVFLNRGDDPAVVLPEQPVEIGGGRTWIAITDARGDLVASSAEDGGLPVSLESCRAQAVSTPNCFFVPEGGMPRNLTLQIADAPRQAVVSSVWESPKGSGYVFVGRSRTDLDERWMTIMRMIAATWLAGLGAFVVANRMSRRD